MDWAPQQDAALKAVDAWMGDPGQQLFRLFGYAGTGKTTLAKHFAEHVDGITLFSAYTGKAAQVLRNKGCPGATTIHSLIYNPRDKSRQELLKLERALMELTEKLDAQEEAGEPFDKDDVLRSLQLKRDISAERVRMSQPAFALKEGSVVEDAELIVVDECSMVDGRMGQDLLSWDKKVLVLGDPAQLPPVGAAGFFTDHEPDFMLTDIHRQAKDDPIIALATAVRKEHRLKPGQYGSSNVLPEGFPLGDMPLEVDQILVGRNATRRKVNARMRERLDLGPTGPSNGEKVICLRNDHDIGILNGGLWTAVEAGGVGDSRVLMTLDSLDDPNKKGLEVIAWSAPFDGEEMTLAWWDRKEAAEFDYGYAITVHKSQGSQWGNVLLFDESAAFRNDRWRWLYTGITRAVDSINIYPY